MSIYDVDCTIANTCYSDVLVAGLNYCTRALVVVRPKENLFKSALDVINNLHQFNSSIDESSNWPGTSLLLEKARIIKFDFTDVSVDYLLEVAKGFFSWEHPLLPEDLCLLRSDSTPWFVSIAHERDCYFELVDDEVVQVIKLLPQLGLARHISSESDINSTR